VSASPQAPTRAPRARPQPARATRGRAALARLAVPAALALAVLVLLPAIHTPFRFDDTFNYEIRTGLLATLGESFGDYLGRVVGALFDYGRIQPLGVVLTLSYWTFSDAPTLYKLFLVVTTVAGFGLLVAVLRRLGVPTLVAALVVVLAAGLVQFRWYHDPVLGYNGSVQWSVILLGLTLLAWLRWDEGRGRGWLAAALAGWTACILFYDANLTFLAVVLAVVVARRPALPRAARAIAPFAAIAVLYVAAALLLRRTGSSAAAGYEAGVDPAALVETYLVTLLGALPASYALWDPSGLMGDFTAAELLAGAWRGALVGVLVGALAWAAARRPGLLTRRAGVALLLVGAALWLAPSALVALAVKYQQELVPGQAYLTVLPQTLGVAMLLALGAASLAAAAGRRSRAAGAGVALLAAGAVGLAVGATGTANLRVVANEYPTLRTRALLNDALRAGLVDPLPYRATVVGLQRDLNWYPINYGGEKVAFDAVTWDRSGRRLDMRVDAFPPEPCGRPPGWPLPECAAVAAEGAWLAVRPVRGGGAVILARSPRGRVADPAAPARGLRVYAEGTLAEGGPPRLTGTRAGGGPWASDGVRWRREGERLWAAELPAGAPGPATSSLTVPGADAIDFVAPRPVPERARALGVRQLLP